MSAVHHTINHLGYLIIQNDVGRMAKAYVSDISLFLSSANKENK